MSIDKSSEPVNDGSALMENLSLPVAVSQEDRSDLFVEPMYPMFEPEV